MAIIIDDDDESGYSSSSSSFSYSSSSSCSSRSSCSSIPSTPKVGYQCNYPTCSKFYKKPSRLTEHLRTHTNTRSFSCNHPTCTKSFFRQTHLAAHLRSHLPVSERPLACLKEGCDKRFWTRQHREVHVRTTHEGERPFVCEEEGCIERFVKHGQLRRHKAARHAPDGTKAYPCTHPGCEKSFETAQHLKTHIKTHDGEFLKIVRKVKLTFTAESRYTCSHPSCLSDHRRFPTWSALRAHHREAHPPKCIEPGCSCGGRTFTSTKGLKAHLKIVAGRKEDAARVDLNRDHNDEDDTGPTKKRRRGGEAGRDWVCSLEGCGKDFKSKKALTTHTNITHLKIRAFICSVCLQTFGYKHLLQRHMARVHCSSTALMPPPPPSTPSLINSQNNTLSLADLTGLTYTRKARSQLDSSTALPCPFPNVSRIGQPVSTSREKGAKCEYVYTRGYDLHRHLRAVHGIAFEREVVDLYVRKIKAGKL